MRLAMPALDPTVEPRTAVEPPLLPAGFTVLHVLDHSLPMHSGYSFRSLALFREQRRRGWRTAQLTTPKHTLRGPDPETVEGFVFHRTPALSPMADRPLLREAALVRAVARRIAQVAAVEQPHLLHAHSPVLNALACLVAGRRLGLPVVYEVRAFWEDAAASHGTAPSGGLRYRAVHALETWALRRADAVTTICEGLRQDMLGRGLAAGQVTVIPNGVDVAEFSFGLRPDPALRAALGLDGRLVLGFLGSFYSYEGLDFLLAALPLIRAQRPDVVALLVGGGPAEAALKEQARRLGLDEAVRFLGRVPHAEIQRYYDLVEIFVYPRRPIRLTETVTPLKPLEAMARGGIVLASDVGGHRELVRDGETGHLFRAGDVAALAQAVLRLAAARTDWERVTRNARRFVERERSWAVTTQGYEQAYARALRARPGSGRRMT